MKNLFKFSLIALAVSTSAQAATLGSHEFKHQNSWLQEPDSKLIYSISGDVFRLTGLTPDGRDCATMTYKGLALMKMNSWFATMFDAGNSLDISCKTVEKVDHISTDIYVNLKVDLENQSKVFLMDHKPPIFAPYNPDTDTDNDNPFQQKDNVKSFLVTPKGLIPLDNGLTDSPKIEPANDHFFSSQFFSPTWRTSQHQLEAVMISEGSHVIDIALTTRYKNMIMYRPFTVGFSRDANPSAPMYHEIFVGSGCVTNLSVGTTIFSNSTYVSITPVADNISKDNLYRAYTQYTNSKNKIPRNCYHANNFKQQI